MIKVECPHCSKRLSAPPEYSGKQVTCQHCKGKFALPDLTQAAPTAAPAPAVPPMAQPAAQAPPAAEVFAPAIDVGGKPSAPVVDSPTQGFDQFGQIAQSEAVYQKSRMGTSGDLVESKSWLTLFDLRFTRLMAPKLMRTLWLGFLIVALLWIGTSTWVYLSGSYFLMFADAGPGPEFSETIMASTATTQFDNQSEFDQLFRQASRQSMATSKLLGMFTLTMTYLGSLAVSITVLFLSRILFEGMHMFLALCHRLRDMETTLQTPRE